MTDGKKAVILSSGRQLHVRTKTWIENDRQQLVFGKGKTEILELIDREGSIAGAAQKMGLSYKKAWSHIKLLQTLIEDELVVSQKGGGGSGGSELTPRALDLMNKYRILQEDIEAFANSRFKELFLKEQEG